MSDIGLDSFLLCVYFLDSYRVFVRQVREPNCVGILHTKYSHAETSMSSKCLSRLSRSYGPE